VDVFIRVMLYAVIGGILVLANIWYVRSIVSVVRPREVVISPFKLIGQADEDGKKGMALAAMLEARLQQIQQELDRAQQTLMAKAGETPAAAAATAPAVRSGMPPLWVTTKSLPMRVFEATNIQLSVGGVEVSKVLPWVQRALVRNRTIDFSVNYETDQPAVVAGSAGAFPGIGKNGSLWLSVPGGKNAAIADTIAFELIRRTLAADASNKVELLDASQFKTLYEVLCEAAQLKRLADLGRPVKPRYVVLLNKVDTLAHSVPDWYQLNYLAATVAESADDVEKATTYYTQVLKVLDQSSGGHDGATSDGATLAKDVQARLVALSGRRTAIASANVDSGLQKMTADATFAVDVLNQLFETGTRPLTLPGIELLDRDARTAYYERGVGYHAPPEVAALPDVTYWNMVHPFTFSIGELRYEGESGAIVMSYAYAFASVVKQRRAVQDAKDADWVLAPRGVAWIKGEDPNTTSDIRPIYSLKAPGTAYDDPELGKDPQVAHYKDLYRGPDDNGGVHANAGIGSKAFYELSVRVGSDKAARVWAKTYPKLVKAKTRATFPRLAKLSRETAEELYGPEVAQAVRDAWEQVGITL
jgi:hypothetical protein